MAQAHELRRSLGARQASERLTEADSNLDAGVEPRGVERGLGQVRGARRRLHEQVATHPWARKREPRLHQASELRERHRADDGFHSVLVEPRDERPGVESLCDVLGATDAREDLGGEDLLSPAPREKCAHGLGVLNRSDQRESPQGNQALACSKSAQRGEVSQGQPEGAVNERDRVPQCTRRGPQVVEQAVAHDIEVRAAGCVDPG